MAETYDAPRAWDGSIDAPLTLFQTQVRRDWIDEYNHVNIAHYLTICDHANWAFWNWINSPNGTIEQRAGHEYVIVENHVCYLDELALDTPINVTTQLTGVDEKRYVLFHKVWKSDDATLAATNEVKVLGFNLTTRRPENWQDQTRARLDQIAQQHQTLEIPKQAGRGIRL